MRTVALYGLGYIGLQLLLFLAENNYNVKGVDIKKEIVNKINDGYVHIKEPNLEERLKTQVLNKKIKAYLEPVEADIHIIAVPTPINKNFKANIDYVLSAAESISKKIKNDDLVILESTSPVGTTKKIYNLIKNNNSNINFYCCYCPES